MSEDSNSLLTFANGAEVAAHILAKHSLKSPMILEYHCEPHNIIHHHLDGIKEHLRDVHQPGSSDSSFIALGHLCMFPRCEKKFHPFPSETDLFTHMWNSHMIDRSHVFSSMTSIPLDNLVWEPRHTRHAAQSEQHQQTHPAHTGRHPSMPSAQLDAQTDHVRRVYESIQLKHIKLLNLFYSSCIQGTSHTDISARAPQNFPKICSNNSQEAHRLRSCITDSLSITNMSALFFNMSWYAREEWHTDEANYSFMCTVLHCEHNKPFTTKRKWQDHMSRRHSELMDYLKSTRGLQDLDVFMTPVSSMALHACAAQNETSPIYSILHGAFETMKDLRIQYQESLRERWFNNDKYKLLVSYADQEANPLRKNHHTHDFGKKLDTERMFYLALRSIHFRTKFEDTKFYSYHLSQID